MQTKNLSHNWVNLDNPKIAAEHIAYLNKVNSLKAISDYKQITISLLGDIKAKHLIDIGCGTGKDVLALASQTGVDGKVIGVDINQSMIDEAKRSIDGLKSSIEFIAGNAEALDFYDNSFDCARADRVFQHLENPKIALSEMIRVTKSGGKIVISEPDWQTLVIDSLLDSETIVITNLVKSMIRNASIGRQLFGMFQDAGLDSISVSSYAIILTDFAVASEILLFEQAAILAEKSQLLNTKAIKTWIADLSSKNLANKFFSSITGFAVRSVKK